MLGTNQLPAAFMHRPVMAVTEEHQVVRVGVVVVDSYRYTMT
jgi:hypothetical protein